MPPDFEYQLPNGERLIVVDAQTASEYLARVLQSFEDGNPEPLIIANYDEPQGVLIPFQQWLEYLDLADDVAGERRIADIVRERLRTSGPEHWVSDEEFRAHVKNPRDTESD
ncbi:MAG: hypothetical protein J2P23_00690 [Microlunatus sp.]|nr:hypothetical protein [Microlunatus sp.]